MAKYNKKRARELQHDKFRDTAGKIFDKAADQLEGRGKVIVYSLVGVVLVAVLIGLYLHRSNSKADEARGALGRGLKIAMATVATSEPSDPSAPAPAYATKQERAEKAIEVFQLVAAKYGDPYKTEAQYFIATSLLDIDREKGIAQLAEVAKSNVLESATLAKFALAQAKEGDGKLDEAAKLYSELAGQNSPVVTQDTANLRLASVYEKQGKKKEAADLLFNIVEASRKAKDSDGTSLPPNSASHDASEKLQKLDADRYAKLTPEAPSGNSPF